MSTPYNYSDLLAIIAFANPAAFVIADNALERLSEDYSVTTTVYAVSR